MQEGTAYLLMNFVGCETCARIPYSLPVNLMHGKHKFRYLTSLDEFDFNDHSKGIIIQETHLFVV